MIHIWKIENNEIEIDIDQLHRYKPLAKFYNEDVSENKIHSKEVFKYIDYIVNTRGYCRIHGLSNKSAHIYALSQTRLKSNFVQDNTIKTLIEYVKHNLEKDPIQDSINISIRSLNNINIALNVFNEQLEEAIENNLSLTNEAGESAVFDVIKQSDSIMKIVNDIPKKIKDLRKLMEESNNKIKVRGNDEYSESMDGDGDIESFSTDTE